MFKYDLIAIRCDLIVESLMSLSLNGFTNLLIVSLYRKFLKSSLVSSSGFLPKTILQYISTEPVYFFSVLGELIEFFHVKYATKIFFMFFPPLFFANYSFYKVWFNIMHLPFSIK